VEANLPEAYSVWPRVSIAEGHRFAEFAVMLPVMFSPGLASRQTVDYEDFGKYTEIWKTVCKVHSLLFRDVLML
jgi:hypothetical protein